MIALSNFFTEHGLPVELVENCRSNSPGRVTDDFIKSISKSPIMCERFEKFGTTRFFSSYFPSLTACSAASISFIFLRRVPPTSYLKSVVKKGCSVVFCIHGISLERFRLANPLIMLYQIIMRYQLGKLAKHAKLRSDLNIQVLSGNMKKYLEAKGAPNQQIFVIENGVPTSYSWPGRNDDFFQVIFIGRIDSLVKGIARLKKVIDKCVGMGVGTEFVIVGSGPDEDILRDLPPGARFLSFVDEDKKRGELLKSNLMIVTSNMEPFSLAVIEGLSYGLPVVTTPVSGPISILSHDERFGKVATFKVDDIVSKIHSYYSLWRSDKASYYEMKRYISNKAKMIFDESRMEEDYLRMVLKIMERRVNGHSTVQGENKSVL
ncbi:MAG: glycosyltransferase family 4 protein [Candidatus Parvarchaeota archaeon]